MAVFSFSREEKDAFTLRKALFRMILSRAAERLSESADLAELAESEAMEGLHFHLVEDDQRPRIFEAVVGGAKRLRQQVGDGMVVEETVLPGVEEKLDELIEFLGGHAPSSE